MPGSITKPRLTISEHLTLIAKALTILPLRLFISVAKRVIFAIRNWYAVKFYVLCGAINVVFQTLNDREIQARSLSTSEAYRAWLTSKPKRRLSPRIQPLEGTGGNLLWIGDPSKATKIVLFFHGGGYVAPAMKGHFEWCWNAYIQAGREEDTEVAVACLQYTLLTEGRFPIPLQQAAAALNKILHSGVDPSNIIIGGDSAGGNLTMQIISHILHPHEEVNRIHLPGPLGGIFLVSPWLSNNLTMPSFKENDGNDMISSSSVNTLGILLYGEERLKAHQAEIESGDYSAADPHQTPLDADETWLDGIGAVAPKIYVTVGQNEILRDHGRSLVTLLKNRGTKSDIRFEIAQREAHDFILLEGMFGEVGDATLRMKSWFKLAIKQQ